MPEPTHLELERELARLSERLADAERRNAELQARLDRESTYLREEVKSDGDLRTLTGNSPGMKAVRQAIQTVARTNSTVLIQGETGTGKELVARAIHQLSSRRDHLLVAVNCAALAPALITSELFGHEAGAFTGAGKRRIGRFESAHRGTIFLDEVGEIAPEIQVLLLRALQERVIERVGGGQPIPVDVRVIAATNHSLADAVADGGFRADLYYRLNVFPIALPALRERRKDIPDLVKHFIHRFNRLMSRNVDGVDPEIEQRLADYDWPGNVRELENIVERAMIVTHGDTLYVDPNWLAARSPLPEDSPSPALAKIERAAIVKALSDCGGKIYGSNGAARRLGLKPTTLYGKLRKHGIALPTRGSSE